MSLGYGAYCQLVATDKDYYYFAYESYNINKKDWKLYKGLLDGILVIHRSYFPEPTIHLKKKKMPSKRRKIIEKKIYPERNLSELISSGDILIENCSQTWKQVNGIDNYASMLLYHMRSQYEEIGIVEDSYFFFC